MQLDRTDTLTFVSDGQSKLTFIRFLSSKVILEDSSLTSHMCKMVLRMCLKSLWDVGSAFNERGNSVPLSSYVCIAFVNLVLTRRIHEEHDPTVRVVGRCIGALVVNKLAADIRSRAAPIENMELECLSGILGIKTDDIVLLLRHPGAIELTNIVFLAWANIDFPPSARVPSDVPDVVQQTFSILSQALPTELNETIRLDQTDAPMNVSDGRSTLIFNTVMSNGAHQVPRHSRPICPRGFCVCV